MRRMISKEDERRIRDDAFIAHDALESLVYAPNLDPSYISEKLNVVRRCVRFIEHFEKNKGEE